MAKLGGIASAVSLLNAERKRLASKLKRVDTVLSILAKLNGYSGKRTLSTAAHRKISLAQKARWAKHAAANSAAKPKRTMSAAARRKIAAAQRARWAKVKAGKKAA